MASAEANATKVFSRWLRNDLKNRCQRGIFPISRHRFIALCRNAKIDPEIRSALVGPQIIILATDTASAIFLRILEAEIKKTSLPPSMQNSYFSLQSNFLAYGDGM